jgi:hypothetical protein
MLLEVIIMASIATKQRNMTAAETEYFAEKKQPIDSL